MTIKTYTELIRLPTFEERFQYLKLDGLVGEETFGHDRWLNQRLYKDPRWLRTRDLVIVRDSGCDLGLLDRPIPNGLKIIVHHINPVTKANILNGDPVVFDLENLISTIKMTHDAIHYGDISNLPTDPIERSANDMCPWKR